MTLYPLSRILVVSHDLPTIPHYNFNSIPFSSPQTQDEARSQYLRFNRTQG